MFSCHTDGREPVLAQYAARFGGDASCSYDGLSARAVVLGAEALSAALPLVKPGALVSARWPAQQMHTGAV